MLEWITLTLGPVATNCYLLADRDTGEAAALDPGWDGEVIADEARRRGWRINHLWYTHAHFDHFGGAAQIAAQLEKPPLVAMHPADYRLWQNLGGAPLFGLRIDRGPKPTVDLAHGQSLTLGDNLFEVRHCPGHTAGHVLFYCAQENLALVGDLIFRGSIGRTDLPGGDYDTLIESIHAQVLSLPNATRLLPGHGEITSVAAERSENPYLND